MGEKDRWRGRGAKANRDRKLTEGGGWPSRKEKPTTEEKFGQKIERWREEESR